MNQTAKPGRFKRGYLWVLSNTLNRATTRFARSGRGPFSLIRHVGRKSGTVYETPLIVAKTDGGFIIELTYGPDVSWYRNIVAAGECVLIVRGTEHHIDRIEPYPATEGVAAFGFPAALVLKMLRRQEFRYLHEAGAGPGP